MKREEVTVCEKEGEEDKKKEQTKNTNENRCWKYNRTTPRTTPERPPERPLIHELSSAGPRAIIDHNMKFGTPCATAPLLHPKPSNKENERPSHPKEAPCFPSQQASQQASKQQAASSSKQQQAATASSRQAAGKQQQASSSRQAAASKQQPAFAPLKEWTNISFKNQRDTKNWTFSRRTALKQWNRSITKSCDDAKLELFPGARPPDTTLRNWYDLNRALVWSSKNPTEIHGFDPQKPLKRFNKSLQIS